MKMLTTYDGSLNAKAALGYGLRKLREEGGSAVILQVFDSGMFIGYGAGPGAEAAARREMAVRFDEAKAIIEETGTGGWIRIEQMDGDPETVTIDYATERHFDVILAPARFKSLMRKAPCPVILFPGNILVPIDATGHAPGAVERIVQEAVATGSKAVVMGVVPVHIYSAAEADEEALNERETASATERLSAELKARGIETASVLRRGYPDEEIMRAMREFSASMIILPTVEDVPSELSKAAGIILDEAETGARTLMLMAGAARG
ncbi:MAG: universal stress protein [Nitrospirae bacterium]|nr:universal stress protein [Nitrospirota bacterium]